MMELSTCFSFYGGDVYDPKCTNCRAKARCKAVTLTHGLGFLEKVVNDLLTIKEGVGHVFDVDTDRVPELVDHLTCEAVAPGPQAEHDLHPLKSGQPWNRPSEGSTPTWEPTAARELDLD